MSGMSKASVYINHAIMKAYSCCSPANLFLEMPYVHVYMWEVVFGLDIGCVWNGTLA